MIISEGLKNGDLENLILPLLTIDQYESKISDESNIVVGFYVFEEDAAHDLSNFIERSPYLIQDTDVSPSPTKDGYYITFTEIQRNPKFPDALINLLDEITLLCGIKNWQYTCQKLGDDHIKDVTKESLKENIDCEVKSTEYKGLHECFNFFKNSALTNVSLEDSILEIEKYDTRFTFHFNKISNDYPTGVINLSETDVGFCKTLEHTLEGPFNVYLIDNQIVIENLIDQSYMILEK